MKAKDIMEQVDEFLSPDDTLKGAVNKMRVCKAGDSRLGVKGMLVLDAERRLLGILSIKDILKTIIPSYLSASLSEFSWDGMLEDLARRYADKKVGDIMEKKIIAVSEDSPLMECADFIVQHNVQRVPVVNAEKRVVGIVYIRDIYYALVKVLFEDGREDCRT
jgi:CBS domain-containing protein